MNQIVFEFGTQIWKVYSEARRHYRPPSISVPPSRRTRSQGGLSLKRCCTYDAHEDNQIYREARRESILVNRHSNKNKHKSSKSKSSYSKSTKHSKSKSKRTRKSKKSITSKSRDKSNPNNHSKSKVNSTRYNNNSSRRNPSLQQSISESACSDFAIEEKMDRPLAQCFDLNTIDIPSTTYLNDKAIKRRNKAIVTPNHHDQKSVGSDMETEYDGDTEAEIANNLKMIIKSGIQPKPFINDGIDFKPDYGYYDGPMKYKMLKDIKTESRRHSSHSQSALVPPEFDRFAMDRLDFEKLDTSNTFTKDTDSDTDSSSESHSDEEKQEQPSPISRIASPNKLKMNMFSTSSGTNTSGHDYGSSPYSSDTQGRFVKINRFHLDTPRASGNVDSWKLKDDIDYNAELEAQIQSQYGKTKSSSFSKSRSYSNYKY